MEWKSGDFTFPIRETRRDDSDNCPSERRRLNSRTRSRGNLEILSLIDRWNGAEIMDSSSVSRLGVRILRVRILAVICLK